MDSLSTIIRNDQWAGTKGIHNGLPLILRFRNKLVPGVNVSSLPRVVKIYWTYDEHESGMPSKANSQDMKVFENRLVEALESDLSGVLTAVITTNGYREWVYYVSSIETFASRLQNMPQEQEPYPIEIETEDDPKWEYYFNQVRPE